MSGGVSIVVGFGIAVLSPLLATAGLPAAVLPVMLTGLACFGLGMAAVYAGRDLLRHGGPRKATSTPAAPARPSSASGTPSGRSVACSPRGRWGARGLGGRPGGVLRPGLIRSCRGVGGWVDAGGHRQGEPDGTEGPGGIGVRVRDGAGELSGAGSGMSGDGPGWGSGEEGRWGRAGPDGMGRGGFCGTVGSVADGRAGRCEFDRAAGRVVRGPAGGEFGRGSGRRRRRPRRALRRCV